MPEKSVNININYKVNTVEIQKAETLLKQAQAATNSFQASSEKAGTATSAAFKTTGASIETVNAKLISLRERIRQSSDPKQIKALGDQYRTLKTQIDAANKAAFETPKALKQTGTATQSLSGQLGQLYNAAKLAFTAGIIKEVVTTGLEMAKLAGNVEGVGKAFERQIPNSSNLLQRLRDATKGTVTDLDLMQRALKAQNFGINVQKLPELLEFAAIRAQQTGESVEYLVQSIVDGLGRKSLLKLDNLGISASRLKEQFNGVALASLSVAQVTDGVSEIIKEEMQKIGAYVETSATKVDKLTVAWEKVKLSFAQRIDSSGLIDFVTTAFGGLSKLISALDSSFAQTMINLNALFAAEASQNQANKQANVIIERIGLLKEENRLNEISKEVAKNNDVVNQYENIITANKNRIGLLKEEIESLETRNKSITGLQKLGSEESKLIKQKELELQSLEKSTAGYLANKDVMKQVVIVLGEYEKGLKKSNSVVNEQLGLIEELELSIEALGDSIHTEKSRDQLAKLNGEMLVLKERLKELQELGTKPINIHASLVYDIKQNLSTGKIKVDTSDLIDTQSLEADTAQLFHDLGVKSNEEFAKGMSSTPDISTEFERMIQAHKDEIINAGIDITANALTMLVQMEADGYDERLNMLNAFYDEQIFLAGDNEKAKDKLRNDEKKKTDKLRREQARKEQEARKFSILIDTAAGIAKAFAEYPYPYALIPAALVAAAGAVQYAAASKAPRGFAKGGLNIDGAGTGTSDSIPANLSRGESVMTAKEWQTSKNVLKEVRAKTLDDKVLSDLKVSNTGVTYQGRLDDSRLLSKLDEIKNSMPDVEERSGLIYATKKKGDNYRLWVRKSSMSS